MSVKVLNITKDTIAVEFSGALHAAMRDRKLTGDIIRAVYGVFDTSTCDVNASELPPQLRRVDRDIEMWSCAQCRRVNTPDISICRECSAVDCFGEYIHVSETCRRDSREWLLCASP